MLKKGNGCASSIKSKVALLRNSLMSPGNDRKLTEIQMRSAWITEPQTALLEGQLHRLTYWVETP